MNLNSGKKQLKVFWLDISINSEYRTTIMTLRKDENIHSYLRMRSVCDYFDKTNLFTFVSNL